MKNISRITGIGIDCIEISRFNDDFFSKKKMINNIFTDNEKKYCFSKAIPSQHLAARFAAKEAVIKALNQSKKGKLFFKDIEILNNDSSVPFVNLLNGKKNKINILLSLSHSDTMAIAFVIIFEKAIEHYDYKRSHRSLTKGKLKNNK